MAPDRIGWIIGLAVGGVVPVHSYAGGETHHCVAEAARTVRNLRVGECAAIRFETLA